MGDRSMRFEEMATYAANLSGFTIIWIVNPDEKEAAIGQLRKSGLECTLVHYVMSDGEGTISWAESPEGDAILAYRPDNRPESIPDAPGNWYQTRGYVIWRPDIVPFYIGHNPAKFCRIEMNQ
jgi:hypothetical protein